MQVTRTVNVTAAVGRGGGGGGAMDYWVVAMLTVTWLLLLGSPSTVANSLPGTEKFALDLAGPACRWLELGLDGSVSTGLMRVGSRRQP